MKVDLVRVICTDCDLDAFMPQAQADIMVHVHRDLGCRDPKIVEDAPKEPREEGWGA